MSDCVLNNTQWFSQEWLLSKQTFLNNILIKLKLCFITLRKIQLLTFVLENAFVDWVQFIITKRNNLKIINKTLKNVSNVQLNTNICTKYISPITFL